MSPKNVKASRHLRAKMQSEIGKHKYEKQISWESFSKKCWCWPTWFLANCQYIERPGLGQCIRQMPGNLYFYWNLVKYRPWLFFSFSFKRIDVNVNQSSIEWEDIKTNLICLYLECECLIYQISPEHHLEYAMGGKKWTNR